MCRDVSIVKRATQNETRYQQLAKDWAKNHDKNPTVMVDTRGVVPERTVKALQTQAFSVNESGENLPI